MKPVFEILSGTPYYVWIILIVLVLRASSRLSRRETSLRSLAIVPMIILTIAVHRVLALDSATSSIAMVAGMLAGMVVATALKPGRKVLAVHKGRIVIDGEWQTLAFALALFVALYIANATKAVAPQLAQQAIIEVSVNLTIGMTLAFSTTRSVLYLLTARAFKWDTLT